VAVESSTIRAQERMRVSPAGTHAVFPENHSRSFSQTDSRMRSSFVSIGCCTRPEAVSGCAAKGGRDIRLIAGVAICFTVTAAGGIPSTAKRWTTIDLGASTDTTYSVGVGDSDCTGAKLAKFGSGPYVVKSGCFDPSSSSCLLTTQSAAPIGRVPPSTQLAKMSAARTTVPSARPRRG